MWALLPGFFTQPTDTPTSFGKIAKLLGDTLQQSPDLQKTVCVALKVLVETSQGIEHLDLNLTILTLPLFVVESDLAAIAPFTKNFMPILFNIYLAQEDNETGVAILAAVHRFAGVAAPGIVAGFLKTLIKRLLEKQTSETSADNKVRLQETPVSLAPG